ncbi:hypothetical protein HPB50_012028 [Hyalomma asiaticum]|uniref:Uncharacterized protein n=1 Tax=Hyalomma asiaticum TaxID=266040 RepID=A0ACB7SM95_HYAAI|nr:hypothetical protein HPB50_012028 [Hyalomma asiaticum]
MVPTRPLFLLASLLGGYPRTLLRLGDVHQFLAVVRLCPPGIIRLSSAPLPTPTSGRSPSPHAHCVGVSPDVGLKMCAIKAKFLDIDYGISVYDIDADMEDSSCAKVEYTGRYKRLQLLRKINDFLKTYKTKSMKAACEKL